MLNSRSAARRHDRHPGPHRAARDRQHDLPAVAVEIAPERGPGKKSTAELDDPDYQARVAEALAAALVEWRSEARTAVIPRHQTILFIVLLLASVVMGVVLWQLARARPPAPAGGPGFGADAGARGGARRASHADGGQRRR